MESRCLYCGFIGTPIFVHGHGQCPRCHINTVPCCEGGSTETCLPEIDTNKKKHSK